MVPRRRTPSEREEPSRDSCSGDGGCRCSGSRGNRDINSRIRSRSLDPIFILIDFFDILGMAKNGVISAEQLVCPVGQ